MMSAVAGWRGVPQRQMQYGRLRESITMNWSKMQTRGGVKNAKNFVDVISTCPLMVEAIFSTPPCRFDFAMLAVLVVGCLNICY